MLKQFFVSFILFLLSSSIYALPAYVILPNTINNYLMSVDATLALENQTKSVEIVKNTLNIPLEAYRTIRIRMIYKNPQQVEALIVYLLSAKEKSAELVRINLQNWQVTSVIHSYHLQSSDLTQSPNYLKREPRCPDKSIQFVIGNNFYRDSSVEKEVQRIYSAAKNKGYNPYLMNVNNPQGPQPTVQAYEDWMSCPNLKGFYNESHGFEEGILLTDGDLTYSQVTNELKNKLNHEVVLFDSCLTFNDPLLDAMLNPNKANTQQYVAGIISLPFGSSERTARCFWLEALNQQALNKDMLKACAIANGLDPYGYGMGGNGDDHLAPPSV